MQINCNFQKDVTSLAILQSRNVRIFHSDENVTICTDFLFNIIDKKNTTFRHPENLQIPFYSLIKIQNKTTK